MVGVPTSRGCDACRKQKKKCIVVHALPPCTRCERLNISCSGYGQQRYKFREETPDRRPHAKNMTALSSLKPESKRVATNFDLNRKPSESLTAGPSNTQHILALSFVDCLATHDGDTRFHMAWAFGPYLYSIPRYLGLSEPLDKAVEALVSCYHYFRKGHLERVDAGTLGKYAGSLQALRVALATTSEACAPTTLCAIMVLMIVDSLAGGTNAIQHAGGAARILKCRGARPPKDELERAVLNTLRGAVAIQSYWLDPFYFTPNEWQEIMHLYSPPPTCPGVGETVFQLFAATGRLFQDIRQTLSCKTMPTVESENLLFRGWTLQQNAEAKRIQLSGELKKQSGDASADMSIEGKFERLSSKRTLGMTLLTEIVLQCSIDALLRQELGTKKAPVRQTEALCQQVCELAEDAAHHRPLGSLWVHTVLLGAYGGSQVTETKERIAFLLADYDRDIQVGQRRFPIDLNAVADFANCRDLDNDYLY